MPTAQPFKALGAGNGFASALTKIDLTSNQTISGSTSLEDAMKAYWLTSRMHWNSSNINLAGGFTYNDPSFTNGSISYPAITPDKRTTSIAAGAGYGQGFETLTSSLKYYDDDFDIEVFQTTIDPPKYALDGAGNKKYFHGIKFVYSNSSYGGYGSSNSATVTFSSGPMLSSAGLAAANQNTSTALYGLVSNPEADPPLQDGFNTQFKEFTQSTVNIGGLNFVKTVEFLNDFTSPGQIGDAIFQTDKNSISNASANPSVEFYTFE